MADQLNIDIDQIKCGKIPVHVGIIMDGNGRWAKTKGKSRIRGHQEGAKRVKNLVELADDLGIKHLSLYAFSLENWARPSFEVSALMRLIKAYIVRERNELHSRGAKFRLLGRIEGLAPEIIEEAQKSTELMINNKGLSLNLCINYSGKAELVDAVRKIVKTGINPEMISETTISQNLYCHDVPDVDLIIRPGGEFRTSNFHLWRSAYSELYFSQVYWPDFNENEFLKALSEYQNRERRFGKTGEQVKRF